MKTILFIIDMQKGFINENTKHLVPKIVNFVKNNKFHLVVGTRYVNNEDTACHIYEDWNGCWEGTEEAELVPEIRRLCDMSIVKHTYSCWNDQVVDWLKTEEMMNGKCRLVFVGVNTGCCVLASAFDAYDDVYDVTVIEDLCGSTSGVSSHNAGVQILRECITRARVIKSGDFITKNKEVEPMKPKFEIGQDVYCIVAKRGSYEPSVCDAYTRHNITSIESIANGFIYVCGINWYRFSESELMSVGEYKSTL